MVGFISILVFAFIFLKGQAAVTHELPGSFLIFAYDDKNKENADETLLCLDYTDDDAEKNFKAEVFLKDTATRPIREVQICNETFTSYTAILWPNSKKEGIWGLYLDYGEAKDIFKGSHPYTKYLIGRDIGRKYNVYDKRYKYHARFNVSIYEEVTYPEYIKDFRGDLKNPTIPLE